MLVRKAIIEGNCRVHDIEMMQNIILDERRPPDTRPDDYTAKRDDHLRLTMVESVTARKYRAMNAFNAKWTVQFRDVVDLHMPLDRATFQPHSGDKFTDEEKRKWAWVISKVGFAAVAENVTDDVKAVLATENLDVGLVEA